MIQSSLISAPFSAARYGRYPLHYLVPAAPQVPLVSTLTWPQLSEHMRAHSSLSGRIELIVASPLRRTLQTALYGFSWLAQAGIPILARAEWQGQLLPSAPYQSLPAENPPAEITNHPCDTGSDVAQLKQEFPTIDFSTLDTLYPSKTGPYLYSEEATLQRGRDALLWLFSRPESVIAVVSHASFLRTSVVRSRFANADYRVYDMTSESELVEWESSKQAGGAMGRSPTGTVGVRSGDFKSAQ